MSIKLIIITLSVFIANAVFIYYELKNAPLVDKDGNLIEEDEKKQK